ncbi:MAG: ArsR family transcriptional regulator [Methanoregulaceae archaeon]|nr:ArsR family transcriptional regulator [Methanoregulaceae archaeon]
MRTENPPYFSPREEEFANLLVQAGIRRNISRVLVYLTFTPEASSREIERATDLRQPEVSMAMAWMTLQGWVVSRETKAENKGRPVKIYQLAIPIGTIIDLIEQAKRNEANQQLKLVQKLKEFIPPT